MAPDPFAHPLAISEDALRIERFVETRNVESFDCGDKAGFLEAQIAFALKRPDLGPMVRAFLPRYIQS